MLPGLISGEDVIVLHGGRDSAQSGTIGRFIVAQVIAKCERVLIVRDSRQSQVQSVQRLIMDVIEVDSNYGAISSRKMNGDGSESAP